MAYRLPLAEFDADDQLPPDFKRVFGKRPIVPRGTSVDEIQLSELQIWSVARIRRDCRNIKYLRICRYADISFFFPTKRYLWSDFGIKIGSRHSQFLFLCTSSTSLPPIQRMTWPA
jgi:hypothetical protein